MKNNCQYLSSDGICKKWSSHRQCKPHTCELFEDPVNVIEIEEVCEQASIYGNSFNYITPEQLNDLANGKVISVDCEEYACFLMVRNFVRE